MLLSASVRLQVLRRAVFSDCSPYSGSLNLKNNRAWSPERFLFSSAARAFSPNARARGFSNQLLFNLSGLKTEGGALFFKVQWPLRDCILRNQSVQLCGVNRY
jgi:hypothetical protein